MKKSSLYALIGMTVAFIAIYLLNNFGVIQLSQPEYLPSQGGVGRMIQLGNTDGLLILAITAFGIIIIPAVGYLRKK
ncbi:MAG TPA: hypothetical protein VN226_09775 [Anaerolineales bacterium]|nr:hypothetical protein [Anaerolineales bacterium]